MAPLKVLIVGGGITGPALGFWLAKLNYDIEVTIIERSPDLRASGQQIDLRGQGVTVMRRMGIESAVREKVVDEEGSRFFDPNGRLKAVFEANKTGQGQQSLTSEFEIMRGDLVRILYDMTKDSCKYVFGTTVDDFEQRGDGVHVKFSDGQEGDFDLLVGADGQGSRTRRRLMGPEAEDPFKFLNLYLCYFTIPKTEEDENYADIQLLPRNRVIGTRVDNPKTTQVYLGVLDSKSELVDLEQATRTGDVKKQKQIWADMYKDAGWKAPRAMDGMLNSPEANDFYGQKIGQVKMEKWSKGRVILLGDAAYCPSPITGKGTSLGLIGPYVLAGELSKQLAQSGAAASSADHGRAIDAAFESYEKLFKPFVDSTQTLPPGVPTIAYAEGEWGVWFRNFLLGLVSTLRLHKLATYFSSDEWGGWNLPDYPELKYEGANSAAS